MNPPGAAPWPIRQESAEVAWLFGAPFLIQVIEGPDASILHVLAGPVEASGAGQRLLDACWRVEVEAPADVVVAGLGGDPTRHTLDDLARAFACASRVVKANGRIILLSAAHPDIGGDIEILRHSDNAGSLLHAMNQHKVPQSEALFYWASAALQAKLFLLSGFPDEIAEDMFTIPLDRTAEVQRLLTGQGTCLFLPDAHKTLAVVGKW